MFFAKPDIYPASGLYNLSHLLTVVVLIILIIVSVKMTKIKQKEDITKIIRILTINEFFVFQNLTKIDFMNNN